MRALENLLKKNNTKKKKLIVTDGVFSMDGDLANIPKLLELAQKYDAYLYIDDAHGYGILGKNGQGILEHYENKYGIEEIPRDRLIYTITLSKAVGVSGALVSANKKIIKLVENTSRAFIYTTAEQPALILGVERSFEIIKENQSLRSRLEKSINLFRDRIENKKLLTDSITPIQPLIIKSAKKTIRISEKLNSYGFYVPAIRPSNGSK